MTVSGGKLRQGSASPSVLCELREDVSPNRKPGIILDEKTNAHKAAMTMWLPRMVRVNSPCAGIQRRCQETLHSPKCKEKTLGRKQAIAAHFCFPSGIDIWRHSSGGGKGVMGMFSLVKCFKLILSLVLSEVSSLTF